MDVTVTTPNFNKVFKEVTPALTEADFELLKAMGARVEPDNGDLLEAFLTFKEDLPEEALFLLESRLEGKSPSEVVKALTDAKEAEEKESVNDGSLPESPEGSEKGSTDDSEPVHEGSAE